MLERLHEQKLAINKYFDDHDPSLDELTSEDWKLMDHLVNVLQPFEEATRTLSGDKYCTLSLVLSLISAVIVKLRKYVASDDTIKKIKNKLIEALNKRFVDIESDEYYCMSSFLDPRMYLKFFSHL